MKPLLQTLSSAGIATLMLASSAQAEPVNLTEAVGKILERAPQIEINRVDRAIAATENQRIRGMLDPVVSGSIGASDETTPTISSFQATQTRLATLTGSVSKPLENGGTLSGNLNYSRSSQRYNSPLAAQLAAFNPAWRNQINLSYRHPLLKGADRPDYADALLAADANTRAAATQLEVTAQTLALQGLNAYYTLASDDINIRIARQAVNRAAKLLQYQKKRESFGLIETADRLQAEALLAARKTDLERALARRASSLASLNRLMHQSADHEIAIMDDHPASLEISEEQALKQAEANRPELKTLQARLEATEALLAMATEQDQVQLDLIAEVGSRALDSQPGGAASRGLSLADRYVGLSLELSDVVGRNSTTATIRKNELQRHRILAERANTMEQIRDDIALAMTTLENGEATLKAARRQVTAEKQKFSAEMTRYRQGRSDTATLVQFEGELRNAELNAELQALTLNLASRQLSWAQGLLLSELGLNLDTE